MLALSLPEARPVRRPPAAEGAGRGALLAAAPMPLLLGLAAATAPESVTLGLAGLALAWLSLRVRHLRHAKEEAARHRGNLARLTAPEVARLLAESDSIAPHAG
ncbi:hypothetical protein [Methylobacterium frigidaeris]|uniref:Uncharacterized protein n=1 Tax=Methylobacterium frigidaeris TaxID=2038277 RepID=A0AA37HFM1_9HYPH|nr:hypothetical protein [Methylobacterium frigidaeris]GJD64669.1 hypothetical protein MPEAHAMD_4854 [Methylobacterium frigidaeris]